MYYWINHNSQCHRRHTLSLSRVWYNLIHWTFLWNSQDDVTGSNKPPQTNQYQSIKRGSIHCTTTSICKEKTHKESKPKACHAHKFTHTNTPLAYHPFPFLFFLPTVFVYAQIIPSHQNVKQHSGLEEYVSQAFLQIMRWYNVNTQTNGKPVLLVQRQIP